MKPASRSLFCILALLLALSQSAHAAADYLAPYAFLPLAGTSSIGSRDATGADARFFSPQDVVTDAAGNVFIVDNGNHTIRKITPASVASTFVGSPGETGAADGTGTAARFSDPQGLAIDSAGNLYVADTGNHTIRKISPAGVVTTLAGLAGVTGSTDGAGSAARFNRPLRLAVSSTGDVFVTEAGNGTIRKISPGGDVHTFADRFSFPEANDISAQTPVSYGAIAVDTAGNAYVSTYMTTNESLHAPSWADNSITYFGSVDLVTPAGIRTTLWSTSVVKYADGRVSNTGASALVVDTNGQLIAASGYQVVRYAPADHSLAPVAGDGLIGGSDGTATTAKFGFPLALSYDRSGTLYIADAGNNVVRKLSAAGEVTTFAGLALERAVGNVDGTGNTARFVTPAGLASDIEGNIYVADPEAHCIRKISAQGEVTTVAGDPGTAGFADGPAATARFNHPQDVIAIFPELYVADRDNHAVRKIARDGTVTTLTADANLGFPVSLTPDRDHNLYAVSRSGHAILRITPAGVVSVFAGSITESGLADGEGATARFSHPLALTSDGSGNLYVLESDVSAGMSRVRKVTPAGMVTTVAGGPNGYADGSVATARFNAPSDITVDDQGNLFIVDQLNQAIRRISPQGAVTTVAGLAGMPGDHDGAGRDARFYYPAGITWYPTAKLFVSTGTLVRQGRPATNPSFEESPASKTVNAGQSVSFTASATGTPAPTYQWYFNGQTLAGATTNTLTLANVRASDAGDYTVVVTNSMGSATSSKATLTVSTPAPPSPPAGSGSGGGGAPSTWFLMALLSLGGVRRMMSRG